MRFILRENIVIAKVSVVVVALVFGGTMQTYAQEPVAASLNESPLILPVNEIQLIDNSEWRADDVATKSLLVALENSSSLDGEALKQLGVVYLKQILAANIAIRSENARLQDLNNSIQATIAELQDKVSRLEGDNAVLESARSELENRLRGYNPFKVTSVSQIEVSGPRRFPSIAITLDEPGPIKVVVKPIDGAGQGFEQISVAPEYRHTVSFKNLPLDFDLKISVFSLDLGGFSSSTPLELDYPARENSVLQKQKSTSGVITVAHLSSDAGMIKYVATSSPKCKATFMCHTKNRDSSVAPLSLELGEKPKVVQCPGDPGDLIELSVEQPIVAASGDDARVQGDYSAEIHKIPDYPWLSALPVVDANGNLQYQFSCEVRTADAALWIFPKSDGKVDSKPLKYSLKPDLDERKSGLITVKPEFEATVQNVLIKEKIEEVYVAIALDLCGQPRTLSQLVSVKATGSSTRGKLMFDKILTSMGLVATFSGNPEINVGIEGLKEVVSVWSKNMVTNRDEN